MVTTQRGSTAGRRMEDAAPGASHPLRRCRRRLDSARLGQTLRRELPSSGESVRVVTMAVEGGVRLVSLT
jgi:hypothetical protein